MTLTKYIILSHLQRWRTTFRGSVTLYKNYFQQTFVLIETLNWSRLLALAHDKTSFLFLGEENVNIPTWGKIFFFSVYLRSFVTTPHSTMLTTRHISNVIWIAVFRNGPKASQYTRKYNWKKLYWVLSSRFIPNFVIFWDHFTIKPYASKDVNQQILFHGYSKKKNTCHVSTLPKSISGKTVSKKALISLQNHFLLAVEYVSAINFLTATCMRCFAPWLSQNPLRIKHGSDCWQLIHKKDFKIHCSPFFPLACRQFWPLYFIFWRSYACSILVELQYHKKNCGEIVVKPQT